MGDRLVREWKTLRTVFISDVHLGCSHSQAWACYRYLCSVQPDQLYLVGDFLDGWKLRRAFRWGPECDLIVERIAELASRGTRLFYTPGNHDAFLRRQPIPGFLSKLLREVRISDEFVHCTAAGLKLLVTHGDLFDSVELRAQWLSRWSSLIYDPLLSFNRCWSRLCRLEGQSPYAWCARMKRRVKTAVRYLSRFEQRLLDHALSRECQGVVCGHIHTPAITRRGDLWYCNTGDWVENCSSLEEDHHGRLSIFHYYAEPAPSYYWQPVPDHRWSWGALRPATESVAASSTSLSS